MKKKEMIQIISGQEEYEIQNREYKQRRLILHTNGIHKVELEKSENK